MQQHPTIAYRITTLHQDDMKAEARRDRDAAAARVDPRPPTGIRRRMAAALTRCRARRRDEQASAPAGAPTSLAR
jgi:hypothetical protein